MKSSLQHSDILVIWIGSLTSFVVNNTPAAHADTTINAIGAALKEYDCDTILVLWDAKAEKAKTLADSLMQYLAEAYPKTNVATASTDDHEELSATSSFFTIFCLTSAPPPWLSKLPSTYTSPTPSILNQSDAMKMMDVTWSTLGFIDSPSLRKDIATLGIVLTSPAEYNLPRSILITGETGVGKTRLAQLLAKTTRPDKPYIHVNCASIPPQLADSMIFGSTKGAFTGAVDREGFIEAAKDGILFLDELGELPLETQAHLLTALEQDHHARFGATSGEGYPINCKFIFGTNKNLGDEVSAGRFREDLLHRISAQKIEIPPLRSRFQSNIGELLLGSLIKSLCEEHGHITMTDKARERLCEFAKSHAWPGNIREFKQLIQNAAAATLKYQTQGIVSGLLMKQLLQEKIAAENNNHNKKDTDLATTIKQSVPSYSHGEIDAIFMAAASATTGADAGKAFFGGKRKLSNYSDAFKKHIAKFGLKWDKASPNHLARIQAETKEGHT